MFISFLFLSVTIREVEDVFYCLCFARLKFITVKLTTEWQVYHDLGVRVGVGGGGGAGG